MPGDGEMDKQKRRYQMRELADHLPPSPSPYLRHPGGSGSGCTSRSAGLTKLQESLLQRRDWSHRRPAPEYVFQSACATAAMVRIRPADAAAAAFLPLAR